MSNAKKEIMNEKISKIESAFNKRFLKISENINIFYYDMLKGYSISIWIPCLSVVLQYAHILIFPFKEVLESIYQHDDFIRKLRGKIEYFLIFPIFKGKENIFQIILIAILVILYIIAILLIVISLIEKSKIKYYEQIISIMRLILPTISMTFFGQFFELLILIFLCDKNGDSFRYNSFKCPGNIPYIIYSVFCSVGIVLFVIISFMTISVFYKPSFLPDKNDSLKKTNSFPNKVFCITKILFIVLLNINYQKIMYIWFILIVLAFVSWVNMMGFFKHNNSENKILIELNKIFSILLFWNMFCLIIGKIFGAWKYRGTIYLYVLGIFIDLMYAAFYKEKMTSFAYINFNEINNSCGQLKYINGFLNLIKVKNMFREQILTFNSLILIKEEICINENCKLKKYLKSVESGEGIDFFLYQYCQHLYELAIQKFPNDVILKVNYVVYLIVHMSKRKLAEKVLYTIEMKPFQFETNFLIFCCKKFVESHSPYSNPLFKEANKNVMKKIDYEKLTEEFKKNIFKASSLYYEFWSVLYKYHMKRLDNFDDLTNVGINLNILINNIEENFNNLHNAKGDDTNILFLYSGFIKYILGDKIKYNKLKLILESLSNVDKIKEFEIDYTNFDSRFYKESDEHKYIIICAEEENLGTILDISYNACKIFGYNKNELIRKKFTMLLPDLYHKEFQSFLLQRTTKLKKKFYDTLANRKEYIPEFEELFINGKDKSKYIVPIYIKMILVQTEDSEHAYMMNLSYLDNINLTKYNELFKIGSLYNPSKTKEEKLYKYCVVFTDINFYIRTFTSNCQELLGLNTHSMNSNVDLTLFISEFNEALNNIINETMKKAEEKLEKNEVNLMLYEESHPSDDKSNSKIKRIKIDISNEKKLSYKRYIAEKIYSESKLITWKNEDCENLKTNNQSNYTNMETTNLNSNYNNNQFNYWKTKNKIFLLVVRKEEFNGNHFGYSFLFRREQVNCIEKNENNIENNLNDKGSQKKKSKFMSHRKTFISQKSSGYLKKNNDIESKIDTKYNSSLDVKHCKSQKNIKKMPKSLEIEKRSGKGNIVGIIHHKIKNFLGNEEKENSKEINQPNKKCTFKNLKSELSLVYNELNDENDEEELLEIFSEKKLLENFLKSYNYAPKSDFHFSFDLKHKSYKPAYTLNKSNDLIESLKLEAKDKIKQYKIFKNQNAKTKKKESSEYISSNEFTELEEDEENSSSKIISDIKSNDTKKLNENRKKEGNINNDIDKEYYRVSGLNKIKFMIFDFEQEMVVEKEGQKDIKSEVENILLNYKLKLPNEFDKDSNDPALKIKKFLIKYTNKDTSKEKLTRTMSKSHIQNSQKLKKQIESYKKIENELNKKDKERSIIVLTICAAVCNLILLGIGAFSLYFILVRLDTFKNNLKLLINASLLRYYTKLGIYRTRMLCLSKINITENYMFFNISFYGYVYENDLTRENRTKYEEDLKNKLDEDFFLGLHNLEQMIGTNLLLKQERKNKLYNEPFANILRVNEYGIKNVTSSLIISLSQLYSHFYFLIANTNEFEYGSIETLNFILNALNSGEIAFSEIIKVYFDEIIYKINNNTKMTYAVLSIYFVLFSIIFIIIKINYTHIISKKDNYISTFYQINISFIKTSMQRCEKFLNQINPNERFSNKSINKENDDNSISYSNFDEDLVFQNEQAKKNSKNNIISPNEGRNGSVKKKKDFSLLIIFIMYLLISFLYMLNPFIIFNNYVNKFEIMSIYVKNMLHLHDSVLSLYNSFNEFLFLKNSTVENLPVLTYLDKKINETYENFIEELNYIAIHSADVPGLYDVFLKIQKEELCKEQENGLTTRTVCEHYVETVTSLGFYNFVTFLLLETKVKVSYAVIIDQSIFKGLWTNEQRLLTLFNTLHYDMDIMFNHVVLHYINMEIDLSLGKILDYIDSKNIMYISIYITYFALIIISYLFYWNSFITNAQYLIYKTKMILNIIPVEILESQTNIKTLLGISDLME